MTAPSIEINSERSRIRAALVNSGRYTFAEAEEVLAASRLRVVLGEDVASTPAGQAAFLTAVVTGIRSFGRVTVGGALDQAPILPLPTPAQSMGDAVAFIGADTDADDSCPAIWIGNSPGLSNLWGVQAFWDGWIAGTSPIADPITIGRSDCALAGVAAGALAVGQAFMAEQGEARAGRMAQRLNLWQPEMSGDGALVSGPLVHEIYLPLQLWLIGLGNLGQSYIWSLSLLPYTQPEKVLLFLQDDQEIGKENWGTSVLVQRGRYGILKTWIAEEWATTRGFKVRRVDRRVDEHLFRSDMEPGIALAGLDGMTARRLLGGCGFDYIIDAGLGSSVSEYRKFRINVFDRTIDPAAHFDGVEDQTQTIAEGLMRLPSYQEVSRTRDDGGCGAAMLAEISVAVPFVSSVIGALALTQAIRIASHEPPHLALVGDVGDSNTVRGRLGSLSKRMSVPNIFVGCCEPNARR